MVSVTWEEQPFIPLLSEGVLYHLRDLSYKASPREAVGLIFSNQVLELPNRAGKPESTFEVTRADLRWGAEKLGASATDLVRGEVILWHSHPGGGVGPSLQDLRHKTPFKYHLVVALVDGDIIPTWY